MASNFRDFVREKNLLTEEQFKEVNTDANNRRQGTFYSSLLRSNYMDEKDVVALACEFFGFEPLENPFALKIDFDISMALSQTVDKIIEDKQFCVIVDGEPVFVLNDPEIGNYKTAATSRIGKEPKCTLITSDQYEIFSMYQIKPYQSRVRSDEIVKSDKPNNMGGRMDNVQAAPAEKLLNSLMESAIERRASDLHIRAVKGQPAIVFLRVDGKLQYYTEIQENALENLRNKLKTWSKVGGEKPTSPVEGQIQFVYKGDTVIDVRVNVVAAVGGYDFVLRFISAQKLALDELGLSQHNQNLFRKFFSMTKGLVLVCGPTGSGKTTLVYSMLSEKLENHDINIMTVEDPVEIILPGAVQLNVEKTYSSAGTEEIGANYLKNFVSVLRHDPDIIFFGEIREASVARRVIEAANTGHLMISTIHANDAVSAITRMLEMEDVEPYTLGDALVGVVAQRLVRRVCPACKEKYKLPLDHHWRKDFHLGDGEIELARGTGCAKCAGSGYFGRIAINEILVSTPEMRDAIQVKAPRSKIERELKNNNFISYVQDGIEKALAGIISFDDLEVHNNDILSSIQQKGEENE